MDRLKPIWQFRVVGMVTAKVDENPTLVAAIPGIFFDNAPIQERQALQEVLTGKESIRKPNSDKNLRLSVQRSERYASNFEIPLPLRLTKLRQCKIARIPESSLLRTKKISVPQLRYDFGGLLVTISKRQEKCINEKDCFMTSNEGYFLLDVQRNDQTDQTTWRFTIRENTKESISLAFAIVKINHSKIHGGTLAFYFLKSAQQCQPIDYDEERLNEILPIKFFPSFLSNPFDREEKKGSRIKKKTQRQSDSESRKSNRLSSKSKSKSKPKSKPPKAKIKRTNHLELQGYS